MATVPALLLWATHALAQQTQWYQLPRMQLERQYAGPLKDPVVQRWRDQENGYCRRDPARTRHGAPLTVKLRPICPKKVTE